MMPQKELTPQEKVTKEWDGMAGEWDDVAGGAATALYKYLTDHDLLPPSIDESLVILDFGCGTGLLTQKLVDHYSNNNDNTTVSILALDASPAMTSVAAEKQKCWANWDRLVKIMPAGAVAEPSDELKSELIDAYQGEINFIVASSVLNFIPVGNDLDTTMAVLGELMAPNATLVHMDWPKNEEHENGMSDEKAWKMYRSANLTAGSITTVDLDIQGMGTSTVVIGVADKV